MLVGFISILLTIIGPFISNRCVAKPNNSFMMCPETNRSHLSPSEAHAPELSPGSAHLPAGEPGHELFPPPLHEGSLASAPSHPEASSSPSGANHQARRLLSLPPYTLLPGNEGAILLPAGYRRMDAMASESVSGNGRRKLLRSFAESGRTGGRASQAVFRRMLSGGGEAVACPKVRSAASREGTPH